MTRRGVWQIDAVLLSLDNSADKLALEASVRSRRASLTAASPSVVHGHDQDLRVKTTVKAPEVSAVLELSLIHI